MGYFMQVVFDPDLNKEQYVIDRNQNPELAKKKIMEAMAKGADIYFLSAMETICKTDYSKYKDRIRN